MRAFWGAALAAMLSAAIAAAATPTTVSVMSSVNPATYGQAVTLTATVSPSAATGNVTFYDGVTVLGISSLASGQASLKTPFLQAGGHSLWAYYAGSAAYLSSKSSTVSQTVDTVAEVAFSAPATYTAGSSPFWAVVADFNGDGKPDVAVTNTSSSNISVFLGNGDGTFQAAVNYATGSSFPASTVTADFNGDGKTDLAVKTATGISVLLGNGDGTFQTAVNYNAAGFEGLAAADFNGDGIVDLATESAFLAGKGDGTFQTQVSIAAGSNAFIAVAGDFNGDGVADLAVTTNTGVSVSLGNGNGTFQTAVAYNFSSNDSLRSIAIADFNGDGKADLAVTGGGGGANNGIEILLGNGDGTFNISSNISGFFWSATAGDFNGDGKADLFVADNTNAIVTVFLGNGDGTFQAAATHPAGIAPIFLALGNFNGDGRTDIAMASVLNSKAGVLIGSAAPIPSISTSSLPAAQFGVSYSTTLSATGGVAPYGNWTVTSGTLPPGLTLNASSGAITGTPNDGIGSPFHFSVTVQDHNGGTSPAQALSITVIPGSGAAPQVTTTTLPVDTLGVSYSATLAASGGTPPYGNWTIAGGSLAPGLTLNAATGAITGTPTNTATSSFSVTVQDTAGNTSPEQALTIGGAAPVKISTLSLPGGNVGTAYSQTLTATGGSSSTYTWAVASGSLPPGLTLNTATGAISGTPSTTSGSPFSFSITASDTAGRVSAAQNLSIVIAASAATTTVTLTSSANPAVYFQVLTLTATVMPATAAGKVTFYDDVNVLETIPVSGGTAVLKTIVLGEGSHSLRAYFNGLPSYSPSTSASLPQTVNTVAGNGFRTALTCTGCGGGSMVVVADFNGDGKADFTAGSVIALGNGDGTFQTNTTGGNAVAAADFNGDGIPDLATPAKGIELGNGDGTFKAPIPYPSGSGTVVGVADFNGDGKADLATSTGILLGNGDGTFQAQTAYPATGLPGSVDGLTVGDFNGDGKADVLASAAFGLTDAPTYDGVVFAGNGDGTFQTIMTGIGLITQVPVTVADFNGDGKADLAVNLNNAGSTLQIYLGNGDGTFQTGASYKAVAIGSNGALFTGLPAVGDFNGDGKLDIALSESTHNTVDVFTGNGDGTFQSPVFWSDGASPLAVAVGDFNGDGRADIVSSLTAGDATVLLGAAAAASLPQVTTTTLPVDTLGVSYSATLTASGGTPPYGNWTIAGGSLAPGLTLNAASGAITGTPTNTATSSFSVTVQDTAGNTSPEQALTIGGAAPVKISTLSLPGGNVGTAYSQTLTATGGSSSTYTWAVASGSLPPGLTLNTATGTISGTPSTTSGSPFSFSITASDTAGRVSAAQNLSIVIAASAATTTVTLTSSANPAVYFQVLTLTATVMPATAAGKVTFYDDVNVLETIPVSGGTAVLKTIVLGEGSHSLRAYFNGLPSYSPSTSASLPQTVNTVAGNGFRTALTCTGCGGGSMVVVADFNGDGKADFTAGSVIALGNGDGTFRTNTTGGNAVAAADFNGDGIPDLATPSGGIELGNGDGTFKAPIPYPSGSGTVVGVADFNGDGKADLATSTGILLGNGDGTFQAQTAYPATGLPGSVDGLTVGDFNGDGKADVLASAAFGLTDAPTYDGVVFAGNGDGTFQTIMTGIGLITQVPVTVADFNGDGKADLAVNLNNAGSTLQIYLGNGDGTFQTGASYKAVAIGSNGALFTGLPAVGDFNGDGKLDIALSESTHNTVDVFTGNGDGTFQSPVFWSDGASPLAVAVGDFNGDGRADIVSSLTAGDATVLLGAAAAASLPQVTTTTLPVDTLGVSYSATLTASGGTPPYGNWTIAGGSLAPGLTLNAASGAITGTPTNTATSSFSVTVQDTAGNTSPEQALTIGGAAPVKISTLSLPGGNVGTAYSQTLTATGGSSSTYTWAVASGSLPPGLTLNTATGTISGTPSTTSGSPFSFSITASDTAGRVSAAQNLSIVIAASAATTTVTLTSSANPAVYFQVLTLTATVMPATAAGKVTFYDDVNVLETIPVSGGTAVLKTIVLGEGSHSLRAYFNGLPSYSPSTSASLPQTVNTVAGNGFRTALTCTGCGGGSMVVVADFNGDGKADFTAGSVIALGNGDGTFRTNTTGGNAVAAADFNGDGIPDLATPSGGIELGNGDGTFKAPIPYPSGSGTVVGVADFNGDGKADLATSTGILLGNGDGTFQAQTAYPATGLPGSVDGLTVGDFNGDGKADVLASAAFGLTDAPTYDGVVFAGNGDGTFQTIMTGIGLITQVPVTVADFNGDGKADLAVNLNNAGSTLQIYLGNGDGTFQTGASYKAVAIGSNGALFTGLPAVGDFNGDGKLDIALSESTHNTVDVFTGNGDGTFQSPVFWSDGASPLAVAVGDFNGDGRADIVSSLTAGDATVLLGAAAAASLPQVTTTTLPVDTLGVSYSATLTASGGTPPYGNWTIAGGSLAPGLTLNAASGAITGTPTNTATSSFSVTVQDTAGNTSPEQALTIGGAAPVKISTLSLPGGNVGTAYSQTLTATGGSSSTYTWAVASGSLPPGLTLNTATGTISGTPSTTSGSPFSFSITASDTAGRVSAAQNLSIVIAASAATTTVTLTSSANPAVYFQVLTLTATVMPATAAGKVTFYDDVNVLETIPVSGGTAVLKTIVLGEGSHSLRAYFNGLPSYSPSTSASLPQTVNTVAGNGFRTALTCTGCGGGSMVVVADFNGDGKADFTAGSVIALGNGDGTFRTNTTGGNAVAAADFNGDGIPDLATPSGGIELGNGDGTFKAPIPYPSGSGTVVGVADFNGDGKADLATSTGILLGNGDGTFQAQTAYPATGLPGSVDGLTVGDFNGDGKADVLASAAFGLTDAPTYDGVVFAGNGDGTFQTIMTGIGLITQVPVTVADFNGDGKADLAVNLNNVGSTLQIYLGNGDGTFSTGASYKAVAIGTNGAIFSGLPAVGDFNGDGKLDIALSESTHNTVDVFTGNGDGTFQNPVFWSDGASPLAVAVGDFNGDGRADIVSSLTAGDATVLLGAAAAASLPHVTTTSLPVDTLGVSYSATLTASGGTPPYGNWTIAGGSLAPGLTLNAATGVITGTPTNTATSSFSVTVEDTAGNISPAQPLSITISAPSAPLLTVSPTSLTFSAEPGSVTGSAAITISDTAAAETFNASVTLKSGSDWLSVLPKSGAVGSVAGSQTLTVSYDATGLGEGVYTGSVNVSTGSGTVSVAVKLTVKAILSVFPESLSFRYRSGDATGPAAQTLSVFSAPPGAAYSVSSSGGSWLSVPASAGTTPGSIAVSIVTTGIKVGTSTGQVTITPLEGSPVVVPVTTTVEPAAPPQISVSQPLSTYPTTQEGTATSGLVTVIDAGGGTLSFTAQASSDTGTWLKLGGSGSGSATDSSPAAIPYTVDPSGLAPGIYAGHIEITASNGNQGVAGVALVVSQTPQSILLSQTGITVNAVEGADVSQTQSFSVLNTGGGAMAWTAAASTVSGGNWLSVSQAAGSSMGGQTGSGATISANPQGLAAGQYYGSVSVKAPGAVNSPESVSVLLNVAAASGEGGISVSSGAAILSGPAGSGTPQSRQIELFNPGTASVNFSTVVFTSNGGSWLSVNPASGSLPPGSTTLTIQANLSQLASGIQTGTVRVAFDDATVDSITATVDSITAVAIATSATGTGSARRQGFETTQAAAVGCAAGQPSYLVVAFGQPLAQAALQSAVAQLVRVLIVDDCGNPVTAGGAAQVTFANPSGANDPPINLRNVGGGAWEGTWTPANPGTNITLTAIAAGNGPAGALQQATATTVVSVAAAGANAAAQPGGILNSASEGQAVPGVVTPGEIVALYGTALATGTQSAASVPLDTTLEGTQVLLGNEALPLYYTSAGQINAVIPQNLNFNASYPLVVARGTTLSVPMPVTVAHYDPGIFTINMSGSGQGAIQIAGTALLAAPLGNGGRPVRSGSEYLAIYCTGLGAVAGPNGEMPPADGAAAPLSPLYRTIAKVTATIGGVAAPVTYSGLTPELVALDQVDVQVPAGVQTGSAVPVVLTVTDPATGQQFMSNTVTVAIQ